MSVAALGQGALFRAGLIALLETLGYSQVAEAGTVTELKELSPAERGYEILLVHLSHETEDVHQWMREIRAWLPDAKVVFLSGGLEVNLMSNCFAAGASGYLLENLSSDALQESLTLVRIGEKVFPSELASVIADLSPEQVSEAARGELRRLDLSSREFEILRLLASGYSNKLIAAELDIAESTVKVHLKHILRKTQGSNRTQAALWAVRHGIPPRTLSLYSSFLLCLCASSLY